MLISVLSTSFLDQSSINYDSAPLVDDIYVYNFNASARFNGFHSATITEYTRLSVHSVSYLGIPDIVLLQSLDEFYNTTTTEYTNAHNVPHVLVLPSAHSDTNLPLLHKRIVTVKPCAHIYNSSSVLSWVRLPGRHAYKPRRQRSLTSSLIAFMLLTVESNPGPSCIQFGLLNAGSATRKGALIEDLMRDNGLDVLAVCESWIKEDAPDAIKLDIAPPGFSVLHVHRTRTAANGRNKKGGGLAFIHRTSLPTHSLKIKFLPNSFEMQLVGLQVGKTLIKVANIYRPPGLSKNTFLDEFADLLTHIASGLNERLLICGDFNMAGEYGSIIDERLSTLLDMHGYTQHVTQPTRYGRTNQSDNLLDLIITPQLTSQPSISSVRIVSSNGLSDHELVICDLTVQRCKAASIKYWFRNIKKLDVAEFEIRLWESKLFVEPAEAPTEYLSQLESCVTKVLDDMAPLQVGTRPGGRNGARWLDPEAIKAKQHRRRQERQWKIQKVGCC